VFIFRFAWMTITYLSIDCTLWCAPRVPVLKRHAVGTWEREVAANLSVNKEDLGENIDAMMKNSAALRCIQFIY
jgi:hypothetical protein